jgi:hypothetical protein
VQSPNAHLAAKRSTQELVSCLRGGVHCRATREQLRAMAHQLEGVRMLVSTRPQCMLRNIRGGCASLHDNAETGFSMVRPSRTSVTPMYHHRTGDAKSSLGDAKSSLSDAKSSLGDATSSLGDATSSLGDAKSSLGDAKSSLGDAKSSLGDAKSGIRCPTQVFSWTGLLF